MERNHKNIYNSNTCHVQPKSQSPPIYAEVWNAKHEKVLSWQFPLQSTWPDNLVNICAQVLNVKHP